MSIVILSIFICPCKNIDQIMISFTSYNLWYKTFFYIHQSLDSIKR